MVPSTNFEDIPASGELADHRCCGNPPPQVVPAVTDDPTACTSTSEFRSTSRESAAPTRVAQHSQASQDPGGECVLGRREGLRG